MRMNLSSIILVTGAVALGWHLQNRSIKNKIARASDGPGLGTLTEMVGNLYTTSSTIHPGLIHHRVRQHPYIAPCPPPETC